MKLRKKPIIIEANQYTHPATAPIGTESTKNGRCYVEEDSIDRSSWTKNRTYLDVGDWVCTENGTDYFVLTDDYIKEHFEEVG